MRLLTEFGMSTSLRRGDYTQAAKRAVQDALWHNSINLAELFGFPKDAMKITVEIAVQKPEEVDVKAVAEVARMADRPRAAAKTCTKHPVPTPSAATAPLRQPRDAPRLTM